MKICKKCGKEFPNRIRLEDGTVKQLNRRKYCLTCSPLGGKNTKTLEAIKSGLRKCAICERWFPEENFPNKSSKGEKKYHSYCQECFSRYQNIRWCKKKIEAINYKGGVCVRCGASNLHPAAYDFHHVDPEEKEFGWGQIRSRSMDFIKIELDKCILVCSNCHRCLHTSKINWEDPEVLPLWSKGYDTTLLRL